MTSWEMAPRGVSLLDEREILRTKNYNKKEVLLKTAKEGN